MARGRKALDAKTSLKMFLIGKPGSRKSGTAVDIAKLKREDGKPMRVLYIDMENGSIDGYHIDRLMNDGVDMDNIYILYTKDYNEIKEYSERFVKGGYYYEIEEEIDEDSGEVTYSEAYGEEDKLILDGEGKPFIADAIVLDGITVVAEDIKFSAIDLSEDRASIKADLAEKTAKEKRVAVATAGLEFKDYDKLKMHSARLVRDLINKTDRHVIITGRAKTEKKMTKIDGKMTLAETGRDIPEMWENISYEVYTYFIQWVDEETGKCYAKMLNKDRSGRFTSNEIVENPSLTLWQSIIDRNKNRRSNVANKQASYDDIQKKNMEEYENVESEKTKDSIAKVVLDKISKLDKTKKTKLKEELTKESISPQDIAENMSIDLAKRIDKIINTL